MWQVQPPSEVLENMIAVRVHLDDCGMDHCPLRVIPGSHRHGWLDDEIDEWKRRGYEVTGATDCGAWSRSALLSCTLLPNQDQAATAASYTLNMPATNCPGHWTGTIASGRQMRQRMVESAIIEPPPLPSGISLARSSRSRHAFPRVNRSWRRLHSPRVGRYWKRKRCWVPCPEANACTLEPTGW